MKPLLYLLGLFSASPLLAIAVAPVASAQCVVTDVGVQVAVHGSRQRAQQVNDVDIERPERCSGNTITSTGTQVHVGGTEPVRQARHVRHRLASESPQSDAYPLDGPTLIIPVEVQVDVDNAADRVRR